MNLVDPKRLIPKIKLSILAFPNIFRLRRFKKCERKLIPKIPPIKKWSSHRRDFFFDSFPFDWFIFYELTNECDNSSANELPDGGLYYVFMSKYSVD